MTPPDLRQMHMFDFCKDLTPADRELLAQMAINVNTLRVVEKAVEWGHVQTPSYIPAWFEDKRYTVVLQWLSLFAIMAYLNENRKAATLWDIYNRVTEKIRSAIREGTWPREWTMPGKRTVDRRVNEIASDRPENQIKSDKGLPRAQATRAGEYIPNPALYPHVTKILEGNTK
jgi:hypothetical protein